MKMKEDASLILIRNINLKEGLCNETRLIVKIMMKFSILAEISIGRKKGSSDILPCIDRAPSKEEIPFNITRRQSPVRLGYTMHCQKTSIYYIYRYTLFTFCVQNVYMVYKWKFSGSATINMSQGETFKNLVYLSHQQFSAMVNYMFLFQG